MTNVTFASLGKTNIAPLPAAAVPTATREDRPQAQVWLNVGMTIPMTQSDGSVVDTFIALPMGLALDTMEAMVPKGVSSDWQAMVQAKNWLLAQLQDSTTTLEPGQANIVSGLEIQVKRVGTAAAPAPGENPYLAAMAAKFKLVG